MSEHWILKDKTPVQVGLMEWAEWFEAADRVVAKTDIEGARISTVFLGLDHSFGHGDPLLFETMIFGGEHDQHQQRCSTYEEAEKMHSDAVAMVENLT